MADQAAAAPAKPAQSPADFLEACTWALIDAREDKQLSDLLGKMLFRVIVLLRNGEVRMKALEVIKTVSGRVKSSAAVFLPVTQLVKALNAPDASPFERNFAMVFLEMGWKRSPPKELGELALQILQGLSKHAPQHQPVLLHMFLSALEHIPGEPGVEWARLALGAEDAELVRGFLMDVLLFAHTAPPKDAPEGTAAPPPPGMSQQAVDRLLGKAQCVGDAKAYLMQRKLHVAKAVQGMVLSHEAALPLALVASCGAHHEVRRAGEESVKARGPKADVEAAGMLWVLFALFLGTPAQQQADAAARRSPADVTVRIAVIGQLCRSVKAANTFPQALQTIFECIYGTASSTKLKQAGMQFAVWTLRNATDEVLPPIAPVILSGLVKFLNTMSNEMEGGHAAICQLRGFTYSAMGQMAQRVPALFEADTSIAKMLFTALSAEAPEVRVSVQEAVSMSCAAYKSASGAAKEELMALLLECVAQSAHQSRFCAVYWANRLFPFSEPRARYVCLLAVDDAKVEVREEAARGLTKPKAGRAPESLLPEENAALARERDAAKLPSFEAMCEYLTTPAALDARARLPAAVKAATVGLVRDCLAQGSLEAGSLTRAEYLSEEQGEDKTKAAHRFHKLIEDALSTALSSGAKRGVNDTALARQCFVALLDLFSARRDVVAGEYGQKLEWLEAFLFCNSDETRELVAGVLGHIGRDMTPAQAAGIVGRMLEMETEDAAPERRQGCLLALGYLVAGAGDKLEGEMKVRVVGRLYEVLTDRRVDVVCAACRAVGLIGLEGALPVPEGEVEEEGGGEGGEAAKKQKVEAGGVTAMRVVRRLGETLAGKEKESKVYEQAAHALGSLCVACRSEALVAQVMDRLFASSKIMRAEELQLCVGEALACVAGGLKRTAPALLSQLRLPSAYEDLSKDAERAAELWARACAVPEGEGEGCVMDKVMSRVMDVTLADAKPQVRAAGAPYLLCLVKYCPEHPLVQGRLKLIQQHFSFMLSEKSEFMQEAASKGLSLVYEMCDDDATKDELVATLAKGLMSGTIEAPSKTKERDDGELFEEGQIKIDDKALGGGSLTTYKELCTVATELGQPELIYRFLNLAGHQKVWNSRRGAAFGFSSIATQAADRLRPHLPTLIPKLYRYQFDPNEKIQEAMGGLWQMVVTDPDKAKLEYLDDIFSELLPSIGSRLWRVREASCLGLADLLSGKRFEHVEKHLVEVYRMSLRAMDDVKETVRQAGASLNRAVSALCGRLCDQEQSGERVATAALGMIVPFLLNEGIVQTAAEVRVTCIHQLVKVVKNAGTSVRAYIPDIAVVLIESLSSLEPQQNTYVQQHAERLDADVAEKFERARLSASRNSPLSETLELCLRVIDEAGADTTIPRLVPIIRGGVGLPTRCGVAKFVGSLAASPSTKEAVRKHSGKLLKAIAHALEDRSAVVRAAMASCAGRVVSVSKESAVDDYCKHLAEIYDARGAEDVVVRATVGLAFKECMIQAADRMRDFYSLVLPLAFVAQFDSNDASRECWEQVWTEGAGSTGAGVRLHMQELAGALPERLASASWEARRAAATATKVMATELGPSVAPHLDTLLDALEKCVAGRVWDGKETVLEALAALAVAAKGALRAERAERLQGVEKVLVGECARKRKEYRTGALKAARTFAKEFKGDVACVGGVMTSVWDMFEAGEEPESPGGTARPSAGKDADEEAQYEAKMEEKGKEEMRTLALACLADAWEPSKASPEELARAIQWACTSMLLGGGALRTSAVDLTAALLEGQGWAGSSVQLVEGLVKCMQMPGQQHRAMHTAAAKVLGTVAKSEQSAGVGEDVWKTVRAAAEKLIENDQAKARSEAQSLLGALGSRSGADKMELDS